MKIKYKAGDIVELLNFEVPDQGRIGYFMNQYGMIPQVGHRYYVAKDSDTLTNLISLICDSRSIHGMDHPRTFCVDLCQVCLYKPKTN